MGEAKRREAAGLPPRQNRKSSSTTKKKKAPVDPRSAERFLPWLPLNRGQADQFMALTTRGAWIGIAALVLFWVTVRFIGPAAGWWTLADN